MLIKPFSLYLLPLPKSLIKPTTTVLPCCPLFSVIGTPAFELTKCFAPLLEPLTLSHYTIKNSFLFCEELKNFHSNLIMAFYQCFPSEND